MNYIELSKHPDDAAEYVKVTPSDSREEFVKTLGQFLGEGRPRFCTDAVPFDWVTTAMNSIQPKGFYIALVIRSVTNSGEPGAAFACFYFQLRGPNAY